MSGDIESVGEASGEDGAFIESKWDCIISEARALAIETLNLVCPSVPIV